VPCAGRLPGLPGQSMRGVRPRSQYSKRCRPFSEQEAFREIIAGLVASLSTQPSSAYKQCRLRGRAPGPGEPLLTLEASPLPDRAGRIPLDPRPQES
jgi:hypothetical protein